MSCCKAACRQLLARQRIQHSMLSQQCSADVRAHHLHQMLLLLLRHDLSQWLVQTPRCGSEYGVVASVLAPAVGALRLAPQGPELNSDKCCCCCLCASAHCYYCPVCTAVVRQLWFHSAFRVGDLSFHAAGLLLLHPHRPEPTAARHGYALLAGHRQHDHQQHETLSLQGLQWQQQ